MKASVRLGAIACLIMSLCVGFAHGDAAFTMAIGDVSEDVRLLLDVTEKAVKSLVHRARSTLAKL